MSASLIKLRRLASFQQAFEGLTISADGQERKRPQDRDAVISSFIRMLYDENWIIRGFEWHRWAREEEAKALFRDSAALARAEPDQLARLLSTILRQNRFCEGFLVGTAEEGFLARICRRAEQLATRQSQGLRQA